jgi:N-methylhydantoinase A
VPWEGDVREAFHALHEERYGYRDADGVVELVTVQVTLTDAGPDVTLAAPGGATEAAGTRAVTIDGERHDAAIWVGDPATGARIAGPAVIQGPEATILVPPGWNGDVDDTGTVLLGVDPGRD